MSISRVVARTALNPGFAELGDSARTATAKLILDTFGTTIAGHGQPGIQPLLDQLTDWGGKSEAMVLVHGKQLPSPSAALINGVMSHALDYDDGHMPGGIHIMCTLFPAVLAAAEISEASGRDFMAAIAAGVEVSGRLGVAYRKRRKHVYYLPATVVGGFGATAAACRLLDLNEDQTVNALGMYLAQASGSRQALVERTLTKRLQPGFAARSAVCSAALAARGLTGPELAFEGPGGIFHIYGAEEAPTEEEISASQDFLEVERTSVKRFPTCGAQQAAIQAAIDLATQNELSPKDIESVELYLGEGGGDPMVSRPFRMGGEHPQVEAQFCAPYGVALGLVKRQATLKDIAEDAVRSDHEVGALAERIAIIPHWDYPKPDTPPDARLPNWCYNAQMVRVQTKQGRTIESSRTAASIYDPANVSYDDVAAKFRACADFSGVCTPEKAETINTQVSRFEEVPSVREFLRDHLVLGPPTN